MTTMASQITSLRVVYSTVYSDADIRKHQSSAPLAFVWGIHRDRWIPRTKGQLRGKCFHLITSSWDGTSCKPCMDCTAMSLNHMSICIINTSRNGMKIVLLKYWCGESAGTLLLCVCLLHYLGTTSSTFANSAIASIFVYTMSHSSSSDLVDVRTDFTLFIIV